MVEWKELGQIANLVRGRVISKDYIRDNEGDYPVYSSQTANDGVMGKINSFMFDGDYLTWTTDGAYAGTVFRRKGKFNITNVCGLIDIIDDDFNQDFLYYWLSLTAKGYVLEGMGNPKLMSNVAANIRIPIIPLLSQKLIVTQLNTFTSSIENLKEQITQRRKQYEHYRDQLLDFDGKEKMEMKPLSEVCLKTKSIKWRSEPEDNCYYYIDLSSVDIDTHQICSVSKINKTSAPSRAQQIVEDGDVLLGTTRPTLKRYCLIPKLYNNHICSTGFCVIRANDSFVSNKWIYYNIAKTKFWDYCERKQQGAGYPSLSNSDAFAYVIPVPSLSEQNRIINILDKFEACIQNLETQLSLREKQYEYYRNKLLTFE